MRDPAGDLGADAVVLGAALLVAGHGEVVDEVAHGLGGHAGAGVDHRQLAFAPCGGVKALPIDVPHHPPGRAGAEGGDRPEGVDGELAQALEVAALGAQLVDEEARVGDLELVEAVVAVSARGLGAAHREVSARACAHVPNRSVTVPGAGQAPSRRRARALGPHRRAWVRDQSYELGARP